MWLAMAKTIHVVTAYLNIDPRRQSLVDDGIYQSSGLEVGG